MLDASIVGGAFLFLGLVLYLFFRLGRHASVAETLQRELAEVKLTREELQRDRDHLDQLVRQQSGELLQQQLEKEQFFNISPDLICIVDFAGVFQEVNPAWETLLGWKREDLLEHPYLEFVLPEDRLRTQRVIQRTLRSHRLDNFENRYRCQDGSFRWLAWNAVVDFERELVYATARDVTEALQLQEQMTQRNAELQALLNAFPDVHFWLTSDYVIRDYHAGFPMFSSPEELLHKRLPDVMPPDAGLLFIEGLQQVQESERILSLEYGFSEGEEERWHEARLAPLPEDEIFVVVRDVTERRRAEVQLRERAGELQQLNAHLKRTNRELDEFAYITSHDLQEPVRNLLAYSSLLRQDVPQDLSQDAQDDLRFIEESAQRMQWLVKDLLALSRAGRAPLQWEVVSLDQCVEMALHALQPQIMDSKATIHQESLPTLPGDATLLTLLYQNLISNALKFVVGRTPLVQLTAERRDTHWVLGVRDNGIGIAPQHQEQIFQPFRRLHGRTEFPGTGIGLAICRKSVERHGGSLWVESEAGQGSLFCFSLPLTHASSSEL